MWYNHTFSQRNKEIKIAGRLQRERGKGMENFEKRGSNLLVLIKLKS